MDIDLLRFIDNLQGVKILVVGDAILDVYMSGSVSKLCREAPLPTVRVDRRSQALGGAANVAANIADLGGTPIFISVIGDDANGRLLCRALEDRGIDGQHLIAERGRSTLTKQRLIGNAQMLARFDEGTTDAVLPSTQGRLIERLSYGFEEADAVIVSDYDYGVFTPAVIQALADLQKRSPRLIILDSRWPATFAKVGVSVIKPSYEEALRLLGVHYREQGTDRAASIAAHAERILERSGAQVAAVTLDVEGAILLERNKPPYRTYARPVEQSRSTGGGDTFVSAFAMALAAGGEPPVAAELASAASSVVVHKDGTATCSVDELRASIAGDDKLAPGIDELDVHLGAYRAAGKRIVFTNGCFDILHRGHITLLNRAKELGDVLIVGINSDESVRRLKGSTRPINSLEDRVKVLSALSYIDHIIAFDEDSPSGIIEAVRPQIYVKGGDYTRETLPEVPLVESLGGAVCILPLTQDRSTTGIIDRIRKAG